MKRLVNECPNRIFLFARYPVPGQAKTRLIPALGPEGAARLHRHMTEYAAGIAREAAATCGAAVTVCFTGGRQRDFRAWLGSDLHYAPQPSGDLGVRLQRAFETAFRKGAERALAIGADVPGLSSEILRHAFEGLHERDVILGPTADGGYYLIGMKRLRPALFAEISWGTERVCAQTRNAIKRFGLTVMELPKLDDVDRPENLSVWTRAAAGEFSRHRSKRQAAVFEKDGQ